MRGGERTVKLDYLDSLRTILFENFIRCTTVYNNRPWFQSLYYNLKTFFKTTTIFRLLKGSMAPDSDGAAFCNPISAATIGSAVSVADLNYNLDSVLLEPKTNSTASINIPQLHHERHIAVHAKVRQNDAVEPSKNLQIAPRISPNALKQIIILKEVNPLIEVL